jgi:RhtB (resistance to homoserine/threonine) family protein
VRQGVAHDLREVRVHDVGAFLAVAALLVVTPGVDMALVSKNALLHGRRAALSTALGINAGIVVWTAAAALGVAALIRASATAFTVLKLAGAAYLVYLGLQAIWLSRRRRRRHDGDHDPGSERLDPPSGFRQGLVSNLANPKIAVFFTSFIPQFVSPGESVVLSSLALGAMFNLLGVVWLVAFALFVSRAGELLRRPRVKAALDRLTGCVLVGFGVRLATEHR